MMTEFSFWQEESQLLLKILERPVIDILFQKRQTYVTSKQVTASTSLYIFFTIHKPFMVIRFTPVAHGKKKKVSER